MRRVDLWAAQVGCVLVLVGCAQGSGGSGTEWSPAAKSGSSAPKTSANDCPDPLNLPGNGIAQATKRSLKTASRVYDGINTQNAIAMQAARGPAAGVRGRQIRKECGRKVQRRSVVVELFFPKMKESASLSQGTLFVSRFPRGYRIWERAH